MTITLPPALDRLVKDKVSSGLYANESDVVCDALRRELAQEAVTDWVRTQAEAGFAQIAAGECDDITRDELMNRLAKRRAA